MEKFQPRAGIRPVSGSGSLFLSEIRKYSRGLLWGKYCQQVMGGDPSPLTLMRNFWCAGSDVGLPSAKRI